MKRDLYTDVSTRIVAELEAGAAPWLKPWSATAGMKTPCKTTLHYSRRTYEPLHGDRGIDGRARSDGCACVRNAYRF